MSSFLPEDRSAENKKEEGDPDSITFLLSLDLRDYPLPRPGSFPVGVQARGLELSRMG
jgi:hypothetical protein